MKTIIPKFEVGGPKAEAGCPGGTRVVGSVGEGFEPYVTKEAVAARIGVNQRTIRRLMNKGVLGHYKIGTQVRFKWSEVESDLREHCHVGVNPSRPAADGKPNPETRYPRTASPLTREIRKPETRYPRRAE